MSHVTCEENARRTEEDVCAPGCEPDRKGPRHAWYLPIKTAIEWCMALVLLVATGPIILVLAALVRWTSSGPAFYTQARMGKLGRCFRMVKLRSMTHGCEAESGPVWSRPDDPRVTRIGRFLRDTHLDELPQLWNILKGDMSLVGPRPERPELIPEIERAIPGYRERLRVRPGVTGLAQMNLPPDTNLNGVRKKLEYDLYYVREVSFGLDTRVGLCTIFNFIGSLANAMGRLLVNSYRQAIEVRFEQAANEQMLHHKRIVDADEAHSLRGA